MNRQTYIHTYIHTDRQTDRQAGRQTDRQRKIHGHIDSCSPGHAGLCRTAILNYYISTRWPAINSSGNLLKEENVISQQKIWLPSECLLLSSVHLSVH